MPGQSKLLPFFYLQFKVYPPSDFFALQKQSISLIQLSPYAKKYLSFLVGRDVHSLACRKNVAQEFRKNVLTLDDLSCA